MRSGIVVTAVACVVMLVGCQPEEGSTGEPDDGRIDCDAPTAEVLDAEWRSELRLGTETGGLFRNWYLQNATTRLTNNTRHDITASGVKLIPDYKTADGKDAPGERLDWVNIPNNGFTEIPTDGIDGNDSREFYDDNLNRWLGRSGDQPPPLKAIPAHWKFSNGVLEEACREQGIADRIRASRTETLQPLADDAPTLQVGYRRLETSTTVQFTHCPKPGDLAVDKDKGVAITESGKTLPVVTISRSSFGACSLYFGVFNTRAERVVRIEFPTNNIPFTWILGT